ncbi:MAG: DUF4080 domain-containing protein [Clostridia bacterium]|nr:DUF4080 domain-containing protein [Clostridia bacterium]
MDKKKIILAAINSKFIHSSAAVRCVKVGADRILPWYEFETHIFEGSINDAIERLVYGIMKSRPDIVGFSVYIWNVSFIERICKTIKSIDSNIKIILGGPEVSYGIDHTNFSDDDYDMIVCGEGENAFPAAVMKLYQKEIPDILGAEFCGKTVKAKPVENLDEIPFIYNSNNIHELDNKIVYYESSRGCPFSCAYCLSSVCGSTRFLSIERVKQDLDFFIENNVEQVKFVDRTFNCNPKRACEIWSYILSRCNDSKTNFHFEIGADLVDEEQLEILRKMPAGKVQLEIGIQSTNEESLKEVCRVVPKRQLFRKIQLLKESGNINIHTDLIAGLPYENYERFKQSFNEVYALHSNQLQLGFLKLLSGTPLNDIKEKHGYAFTTYPPYEVIKNNYISYYELQRLKEVEDVLERYHNSSRFLSSLRALEEFFDSPFEMYEKIAEFFKDKKLTFMPVASKKLYDLLNEFAKQNGADISENLLNDFYLSENSEVLPESLRPLAQLNKDPHAAAIGLLKDVGYSKEKKVFAKFIGNKALIIDYGNRNPVNGRFKLIFRWTVAQDE